MHVPKWLACGGLHLVGRAGIDEQELERGCGMLAAELAAIRGATLEFDIGVTDVVSLPASGLLVRLPRAERVELRSSPFRLLIRSGADEANLCLSADGRLAMAGASAGVRIAAMPIAAGIRIVQYWPTARAVLPTIRQTPSIYTPDLTPLQLRSIEQASWLLKEAAPGIRAEMDQMGVRLVPLFTAPGARESFSVRELPDVIYCSLPNAFELADLICHEFLHLKLFLLEEAHPLLSGTAPLVASPWRSDLRPTRGLLHGICVFEMIATVFDRVFDRFRPSSRGERRRLIWRTCVHLGCASLNEAGVTLSSFGAEIIGAVRERNARELQSLRAKHPFLAADIGAAVGDHLRRAGTANRTEPWYLAV
jgi:HEXXH motif-containing protein